MESSSGPIFDLFVDTLFIKSEFAIREGYLVDSSLPTNSLLAVAWKMVAYIPASRKS